MDLAVVVYELAGHFPSSEMYRMVGQITRSVVSVSANIAEGRARSTRKDYANFLAIAQGSLAETETYVLLALRLGFASESEAQPSLQLIDEVGRMLTSLRKRMLQR